jgi:hypothetical protein
VIEIPSVPIPRARALAAASLGLCLAVLTLIGCSSSHRSRHRVTRERTDIAATAREASYSMSHLGAGIIQLSGGTYQDSSGALEVHLVKSATGDLDGDGRRDAAVVLASQTGGTGTFVDLFVVLDKDKGPVTRGPASLGDRVEVDSMRVTNRAIKLHLLTHGPDDPLCCPTQRVVETFVLAADSLMRRPSEQP